MPGYEVNAWSGIITTAGVPRPVLDKLNAAVNRALLQPDTKERLAQLGSEGGGGTPEAFAELIRRDSAKWAEVVRRSGAKIDRNAGSARAVSPGKEKPMKRLALFVLVVVSSMAIAQTPTRVRGDHRARGRCPVGQVARRARSQDPPRLRRRNDRENGQPGPLKGKYVGVTAISKDGKMTAVEVHAIPPQAKPGHFPWDLQPGSTMTNANLDGIAQVSGGNEITLNYQGGSQQVLVPPRRSSPSTPARAPTSSPASGSGPTRAGSRRQDRRRAPQREQRWRQAASLGLLLGVLSLSPAPPFTPKPVCAAISAFDGKTLTVDGKTQVLLGETTDIVFAAHRPALKSGRATSSG